jgi:hypothetical protein
MERRVVGDSEFRYGMRRIMGDFCRGGALGLSVEELEHILSATNNALATHSTNKRLAEARVAAGKAVAVMGEGWTSPPVVLEMSSNLWTTPFIVALFVPAGGYLHHIFQGEGKQGYARAVCRTFDRTPLERIRDTHLRIKITGRAPRKQRPYPHCDSCYDKMAPYVPDWLPPQTLRDKDQHLRWDCK